MDSGPCQCWADAQRNWTFAAAAGAMRSCPAPQASSRDAENCPIALTRTLVVDFELDNLGVD
jgi:hypothetical protein